MFMKRNLIWLIICIWVGSVGFAPGSFQMYSKAVKFAKAGQSDFAFMQYSKLLRNYPKSKYRDQALFGPTPDVDQILTAVVADGIDATERCTLGVAGLEADELMEIELAVFEGR